MTRAFLIVLDSVGIGGAADAHLYGDEGADTLGHIAEACARGEGDREEVEKGLSPCRFSHRAACARRPKRRAALGCRRWASMDRCAASGVCRRNGEGKGHAFGTLGDRGFSRDI